jgi:p-cumate 2,3-dioxygenase beta subunit
MSSAAAADARTDIRDIEAFLFQEADLLDGWKLDAWLALFEPDATYEVPATDNPEGRPESTLYIIADDMVLLKGRVGRLKSPHGYAESPPSRTRRFVANVRILNEAADRLTVSANFMVTRMRKGRSDTYVGRYEHELVKVAGGFRFVRRRAVLDLEALRPHGRVTIIL